MVASEVIEHVRVPYFFCKTLAGLSAPGQGSVFVSTLNRTNASFLVAIVGAEYLTGLVPRGTHDWLKFVAPEELDKMMTVSRRKTWWQIRRLRYPDLSFCWMTGRWPATPAHRRPDDESGDLGLELHRRAGLQLHRPVRTKPRG